MARHGLSTFGRPHGPFQGGDQCRALSAQLGLVAHGQFAKHLFALGSKPQQHLTPVIARPASPHQASGGKPVHQFDGAVVLDLQPLSQGSNSGAQSVRQSLEGQHQLVLLRFQPHFPRCLFAEVKKAANLIAQFGQGLVVGKSQSVLPCLLYIVSRYIMKRSNGAQGSRVSADPRQILHGLKAVQDDAIKKWGSNSALTL